MEVTYRITLDSRQEQERGISSNLFTHLSPVLLCSYEPFIVLDFLQIDDKE